MFNRNAPGLGPKTTRKLRDLIRKDDRTGLPSKGGGVGEPNYRGRERWAKASLDPEGEETEWETAPEDRMFPFELGFLDSEREFVGSGTWIEAYAGDSSVSENKVQLLKYMPGDSASDAPGMWACLIPATGVRSGITQEDIPGRSTGTVDVEGEGEVEAFNPSAQTVLDNRYCTVGWNDHRGEWQIISADC